MIILIALLNATVFISCYRKTITSIVSDESTLAVTNKNVIKSYEIETIQNKRKLVREV